MKHLFIILIELLTNISVYAQESFSTCNQLTIINNSKSKTLVKLKVCFNDTVNAIIETYLEPKYRTGLFKRKKYLMTRHGNSKSVHTNGDYKISAFNDGILISESYYMKNGTEISLKKYEKLHPQIILINGITEYYKEGQIYTTVNI
jgi:hypothetical protein